MNKQIQKIFFLYKSSKSIIISRDADFFFTLLPLLCWKWTRPLFYEARAVIPLSPSVSVLPDKSSPLPASAASTLMNTVTCLMRCYITLVSLTVTIQRQSPALSPASSRGSALKIDSVTLIRPEV